jgi:predicted CXXCH cytochrome family protein
MGQRGIRNFVIAVLVVAVAAVLGIILRPWKKVPDKAPAEFAGSAACAGCHATEYSRWLDSNHRHAMETPSPESVLGDFNNVDFLYFGRSTRFFKTGDSFQIATENQQGQLETFTIAYTLGHKPLQQYLVDMGGGRIQALPFAWDSREKRDGGQRWFHLYPKENVTPADPLFWSRPIQNWNHMCGDCHTTGFSKNVSDDGTKFSSHWSEPGNGCESCHGAGSLHVEARKADAAGDADRPTIAALRTPNAQIDQCGVCHSRRVRLRETSFRERKLEAMLETWRPQLPQEGLYYADGQIRDEVFEIGSFLQSKMAAKGVRCTDCHDPHTARLKAEGNDLCTQCHKVETFDRAEHHFHKQGTAAAQCVSCHMPERTYMVVDPRRDHRLAIPRPDLSDTLATPNACTSCHTDRTNSWAAEAIRRQTARTKGPGYSPGDTWGIAAWQASHERKSATEVLNDISTSATPISRATVLASLRTLTPDSLGILAPHGNSSEPLVRIGAMQAVGKLPLPQRVPLLIDKVRDSSLAIRLEAASLLAGTDRTTLSEEQRNGLDAALVEYRKWLSQDADRAESLGALAALQAAEGDVASAEKTFAAALGRDATSLTVLLNFADFYRAWNNDAAAEPLLSRAAALYPEAASVHFALGLLRVRQNRTPEAVPELALAAKLSPDDSNFAYVHAVALYSTDRKGEAFSVLEKARLRFPVNAEISSALKAYCAEQQNPTDRRITIACAGMDRK